MNFNGKAIAFCTFQFSRVVRTLNKNSYFFKKLQFYDCKNFLFIYSNNNKNKQALKPHYQVMFSKSVIPDSERLALTLYTSDKENVCLHLNKRFSYQHMHRRIDVLRERSDI